MCGERENGQLAWLSKSQSFNKPQIHTAQCQTHTNTRVEADTCTHSHTHTGQTVTSRKASPKSGTPRAGGAAGPTDASIPQGPPGLSGGCSREQCSPSRLRSIWRLPQEPANPSSHKVQHLATSYWAAAGHRCPVQGRASLAGVSSESVRHQRDFLLTRVSPGQLSARP